MLKDVLNKFFFPCLTANYDRELCTCDALPQQSIDKGFVCFMYNYNVEVIW